MLSEPDFDSEDDEEVDDEELELSEDDEEELSLFLLSELAVSRARLRVP